VWNMKTDDTYMRTIQAAGFSVADIDYVMCSLACWEASLWLEGFPHRELTRGKRILRALYCFTGPERHFSVVMAPENSIEVLKRIKSNT
jgi:hypothetical protein